MKQKNSKKTVYALTALALLILHASLASAFEVIPAYKEITFIPGSHETVEVLIKNNHDRNINLFAYIEGPLAQYIEIQESLISVPSSSEKLFKYTISMPDSFAKQGLHESKLVLREIPQSNSDTISSSVAISSKIKLVVPYHGKYLESRLIIPDFHPEKPNSFAVELNSLGTEWIEDAKTVISIYGPLNNRIATITSDPVSLEPGEKKMVFIQWTPKVGFGVYRAVATTIYGSKNSVSEKRFTIGEPTLAILGISVDKFKLGNIAKFNILVENQWNQPVEKAFARMAVRDEEGKVYTTFKSSFEDIPAYGQQEFKAYWDTNKVSVGTYYLGIAIEYAEKATTAVYEVFVDTDNIDVLSTGLVSADTEEKSSAVRIGVIVVISLLVVVILLAVKILKLLNSRGGAF